MKKKKSKRNPTIWHHAKHKGDYESCYTYYIRTERIFQLTKGSHVVSFESWQAAKKLGWVKQ
jgi:hypothetical protein